MKKNVLWNWILFTVLLAAYHALVFLVPLPKTTTFWIAYAFTLAAFAVAAASVFVSLGKPDAKSRFYGFPVARVGVIYLLVQFAVGLLIMLLHLIPWWLALLAEIILLCAAIIGLIGAHSVAEEVTRQEKATKESMAFIHSLQSRVNLLAHQCPSQDAAAGLLAFAEKLKYSDPISCKGLEEIESKLGAAVGLLEKATLLKNDAAINDLCKNASALLEERNRLCKMGK